MQSTMPARPQAFADRRVLFIALALGAVAAGLIVAYLASQDSGKTLTPVEVRSVVVASSDIAAGTKVTGDMVQLKGVAANAFVADSYTNTTSVVGVTARYPIKAGEQIGPSKMVETAKGKALSFEIPAGLRAFTISISTNTSPAALIAPGDFVDVIVAGKVTGIVPPSGTPVAANGNNDFKAAVTLIQNVQVLAVQRNYVDNGVPYDASVRGSLPASDKSIDNITLALTPDQAQLLWLTAQDGKVTVALRGFGDQETSPIPAVAEPVRIK